MDKSAEQYANIAVRYYITGYYKDALVACEYAIQLDPTCARAYHGKGLVLIQRKRHKEALAAFQKASQLAPQNAKVHADMAELLYIRRDYENSRLSYERTMQLDSKYKTTYDEKIKELIDNALGLRTHSRAAAIDVFQEVLLFNPGNVIALSQLVKLQKVEAKLRNYTPSIPKVHPANCTCPQCWEP